MCFKKRSDYKEVCKFRVFLIICMPDLQSKQGNLYQICYYIFIFTASFICSFDNSLPGVEANSSEVLLDNTEIIESLIAGLYWFISCSI